MKTEPSVLEGQKFYAGSQEKTTRVKVKTRALLKKQKEIFPI